MKNSEIGPCAVCGKSLVDGAHLPIFYRVQVSRLRLNRDADRRHLGLRVQIEDLASVLGLDEDLAKVISGPCDRVVHEECADKVRYLVVLMDK